MMAKETFWVVQRKCRGGRWSYDLNTISEHRGVSTSRYGMTDWIARQKDGEVRCIEVRLVPVNEHDPESGGLGRSNAVKSRRAGEGEGMVGPSLGRGRGRGYRSAPQQGGCMVWAIALLTVGVSLLAGIILLIAQ